MTQVAILGAGYIADYHVKALRRLDGVEVRAICDLNQNLAQQFASSHGIPKTYGDLGTMLSQENLDVVHVLTPPHIHFPTAQQILNAGVDTFIEKPLCHTVEACQTLRQQAIDQGRQIGVSHNFLYFPAYEKLTAAIAAGELGQLDQVDIIWNKPLGAVRGGPFGLWMLQSPTNILFEVCPHSFSHALHLVGEPDTLHVDAYDKVDLPRGLAFYRRWDIQARRGNVAMRLRFSFIDGYPEHYIMVRGTHGSAIVDFERNLYQFKSHTPYMLDLDRFANTWKPAKEELAQGVQTLGGVVLSKMKLTQQTAPFAESIARTVADFYQHRGGTLDERVASVMGEGTVKLAERIAAAANLPIPTPTHPETVADLPKSTVLVLGGTGFIGQALVKRLREDGYGVRLLSRNPNGCPPAVLKLGVEVVRGDFTKPETIDAAMSGIEYVLHLARGNGKTWEDYQKTDVEPTRQLAELCLKHKIKRLVYTSSVAIYNASNAKTVINEETLADPGMMRVAPYSRSKVENENQLLELHKTQGLPVVITRPGVVLGVGGNPYHWGIAAWNYTSVCNLWGKGENPLPIVLVDDIADALVKAMTQPQIEGETYNLASRPCISANDYIDEIEHQAHVKIRRVPLSARRMYTMSLLKWGLKKVGRDRHAAFPSYADCAGRRLASQFDCSKAERELGWQPVTDRELLVSEGIHLPVKEWLS
ncbi:NAD-dependent epimerase/dehydratase family protein [filamentous cyanobacterium LEGE 11480]|uniref:NAD-dependent epimerase/dehydratase family protein n=2 Tax=Romeriopsis TaxID=2992131 RepID=A0A928Z3Y1_9CYAN|nr:NAD-dependent epimerase/dehydratase family protein [Romeriopsis navalis LEGE 11480]